MCDANGNMAVQTTASPRSDQSPAENAEFVNGYAAYFGTYKVDAEAAAVTHYRERHINPDLDGVDVVRYFQFSDDRLTLTLAPEQQHRLNWARI